MVRQWERQGWVLAWFAGNEQQFQLGMMYVGLYPNEI